MLGMRTGPQSQHLSAEGQGEEWERPEWEWVGDQFGSTGWKWNGPKACRRSTTIGWWWEPQGEREKPGDAKSPEAQAEVPSCTLSMFPGPSCVLRGLFSGHGLEHAMTLQGWIAGRVRNVYPFPIPVDQSCFVSMLLSVPAASWQSASYVHPWLYSQRLAAPWRTQPIQFGHVASLT